MAEKIERIAGGRKFELAEGPVWSPQESVLYWIDVPEKRLWRHDPVQGSLRDIALPGEVGSFGLRAGGGMVLAMGTGFHFFDPASGDLRTIAEPAKDETATRFNDGKVDRRGRFVAGTMDQSLRAASGALYQLGSDLSWTRLDSGITVSNGPCWSPDGRTFYFADSMKYTIFAYDYDLDSGAVSNKRDFAATRELGGAPDGATVDAEGGVWSALAFGAKLARFTPDGRLDRVVHMPTRGVCSCTFGGPNYEVLYATSIGSKVLGVTPDADAGGIFAIHGLGVRGLPEPAFAG
jgi:sugar lactone lactonase YvrE